MRRAHTARLRPTRDICVLCATSRLTSAVPFRPSPVVLQRHINSSSRAPHYAAEAQIYREEVQAARPLSQAERMRQQLLNKPPSQPPPAQRAGSSPAERQRLLLQSQSIGRTQPQGHGHRQQQRHPHDGPLAPRQNSNRSRHPLTQSRPSRYNVNMDSKPPFADTPRFGSTGNLRRRNDSMQHRPPSFAGRSQEQPHRPSAPPPNRRKLDEEELRQLLSSNSVRKGAPGTYSSLKKDARAPRKCFHCGSEDHVNFDCPSKPVLRQPSRRTQHNSQQKQATESLADAAQAWIRKEKPRATDMENTLRESIGNEQRRRNDTSDRRRSRFEMADGAAPTSTRNRYEEPERRQRGDYDRRARGRVMRVAEEDEDHVDRVERKRQRKEAKKAAQIAKAAPTPVHLPEYISVANLASLLRLRVEDFVRKLEELGFEDVQNDHVLNAEHAGLIAQEYNFEPVTANEGEDGDLYPAAALSQEDYANLPLRPPVVTIMGHVDHGKTTILDYIRSSSVAAGEFGGITQHIGAFSVTLASGKNITFLDTPGHSAFETMRARGANVTDIVVLVVAADDSVMPQTVEAIKHAQAANVPIIVAINKIDKQQADPDRVKSDLGRHGIEVEEYGGDVQTVSVSGKTGQGISDLEDMISLQSEINDHRADPAANVEGWVLEGTTKKAGRVATILVRSGTLRPGNVIVAGTTWARVRSLRNEDGVMVNEVGPGMPVEVDGWREQPIAGDEVLQAEDEHHAVSVSEWRTNKVEREQMAKDMEAINQTRRQEAERRELEEKAAGLAQVDEASKAEEDADKVSGPETVSFIIKADVSGSVEAVMNSVAAIGNNEVGARILRYGVGPPSEFDVQHAADAKGHIINFNTPILPHIAAMAEQMRVKILDSNIIYRVVENVKALLSERLSPRITQRITGEVEVAAIFEIGLGGRKKMKVAGSKVRNGIVDKGTKAKVLRNDQIIFDGVVSSLKSQKKDVDQMRKDTECGIAFEGWEDFKVGDKIQCYEEKHEKRSL